MERMKQEWAAFKALPFKKKLEHIWIYYRWYILAAAAFICLAVSVISTVMGNQKEVLLSGMFLNNATSQEGYAFLKEGFWEECGGSDDQQVDLVTGYAMNFTADSPSQQDASSFMVFTCMVAAGNLDYVITDVASVDNLVEQEVLLDLRELLPEEALAQWDTVEHDGAVTALRLEGTAFAENYPLAAEDSCIVVIGSVSHRDNMLRFLDYIRG